MISRLKKYIRLVLSHSLVNTLWHLPISYLAPLYYKYPSKEIKLIGVTGTDGKTTTANLIYHILKESGQKTSVISTVNAIIGNRTYDTGFHVTSPHPFAIQRYLRQAVDAGSQYIVLETTSHGLAQHRFTGCAFEIGVLTNVTHEHLDYHGNYQDYLRVKLSLLRRAKKAVVNKDDNSYRLIDVDIHQKEVTYGIKNADVTPRKFVFETKLKGEFNTYNILASIAVAQLLGIPDSKIKRAISSFSGVPGRMEVVYDENFTVIIDFAHTPASFDQVLSTLRKDFKGKIIHVFGCAGLRDYQKRMLMGEISAKFSDHIVLTEEDYRTENIDKIMNQIEKGIKGKRQVIRIPNRNKAIIHAIVDLARHGDIVLLTGKAHEKSLCRGDVEYPWDEFKAVEKAIKLKFDNQIKT